MLAGDPLRVEQSHGSGLGRHRHLHVKDAARGVARIDLQMDRSLRGEPTAQSEQEEGEGSHNRSYFS